eukprot:jgi/Orpsp1_1/1176825/evm.model.c7180000059168.1
MSNLINIFHKLESVPWEYIDIENNDNDRNFNTSLTSFKKENDKDIIKQNNMKNEKEEEEDKKPMIINTIKELNNKNVDKKDSFQEKIKSIKTISNFSNSLSSNISNSNFNSNSKLTILPLTSLSQTIPSSLNSNNVINSISQQSTVSTSLYSNIKENHIFDNNNNNNNNTMNCNIEHSFIQKSNYYIKYYFNSDNNIYLFMITDLKNICNSNHYLCIELSVPYMYVTFKWNFDCTLLNIDTTLSIAKKENQDDVVAKLDGSKIFYEHLTLPFILMVSELYRRIERYEEVIAKKDKNIKILYDQLVLLEETPPKRFKFEEFDKKIFDKELRFSTDISSSEQKIFIQDDLRDLYKHITNTILYKTFPNLVNDEYKTELCNERLSLIPTLLTESNDINNKENVKSNPEIINNENSSSLSYNGLSDTTLQDDDNNNNNQSILEELEKEKNKEVNIIKL